MTDEKFSQLPFNEAMEFLNNAPDDFIQRLYENRNAEYKEIYDDPDGLVTYDEYKQTRTKVKDGDKCFVNFCTRKAVYLTGDSRYWCGMCEEHAGIRKDYLMTLKHNPVYLSRRRYFGGSDDTL